MPESLISNSLDQPSLSAALRYDWTRDSVREIYDRPLLDLIFAAQQAHRKFHDPARIQLCRLLSIKTGGCPEDCGYCPQSAHYETGVQNQPLMAVEEVFRAATKARDEGASRFCMGAAWREVRDGRDFDTVLEMVRAVASLKLEVCCTLGMLTEDQAQRLASAGLTAYNHNLDTSPEFYGRIIGTRRYEDRLRTIQAVRRAGITVCCGGIIGMGESDEDRVGLLQQLANLEPHPESVPINMLVRVQGTPLAGAEPADALVLARMIATARLLMPASMVRLSAGRNSLSREAVSLCFLAGANSIFVGEKLLTTPNPERDEDNRLLRDLGLSGSKHGQRPS
ncbi:MAG: biotin synthase BioB [Acidobacteria bacterium]|nr:MAG: biotin synthase BioB [Acidobacteriota bacterium]